MAENKGQDILSIILKESEAMGPLENIEKYIQDGGDFSYFPIQPLYLALKELPTDKAALFLKYFSVEQRSVLLDLDLWRKDEVGVEEFSFWLKTYSACEDEAIKVNFAQSEEFLLYLKAAFNIWTFDAEDPEYPDHDYYFLTDDNLLLFEYHEYFDYHHEVQAIIRQLYADRGVEKAYTFLFKLVSDSYLTFEEEEYQRKKERLRDYGFVDYYEALELEAPFSSIERLHSYLRTRWKKDKGATGTIESLGKQQTLPKDTLVAYRNKMELISDELIKIEDTKRRDYLHFSFIRLVNSTISLNNSLSEGKIALTRVGNETKLFLNLGLDYLKYFVKLEGESSDDSEINILNIYEFKDLYIAGRSIIKLGQKKLNKVIREFGWDKAEQGFIGQYWQDFLDNSIDVVPQFSPDETQPEKVQTVEQFQRWYSKIEVFEKLAPFIFSFQSKFIEMKNEGRIQDDYYLNYNVSDIDFEAIILSSFANFSLEGKESSEAPKMGLLIAEYKKFMEQILNEKGELTSSSSLSTSIDAFIKQFGMSTIPDFREYICLLLKDQVGGYDYQSLADDDFKHVGGPILLNK